MSNYDYNWEVFMISDIALNNEEEAGISSDKNNIVGEDRYL